jgi:hypothetical protein
MRAVRARRNRLRGIIRIGSTTCMRKFARNANRRGDDRGIGRAHAGPLS